jgi:hypothetical protein
VRSSSTWWRSTRAQPTEPIHPSAWKGNSANFALPEFYEVRLTAYWGTTATASISTKKSGCARPETNTPVMAGGSGVSGQAF